jgi:hypothetical protein
MTQVRIDLHDADQRPVVAELDIRRDTVEIRCRDGGRDGGRDRLVAVQDRDALRAWLSHPDGVLSCDDTTWSTWDGESVALYVRGFVPTCFLRRHVIERVRLHL